MDLPEGRLSWLNSRQARAGKQERAFGSTMAQWRVVRGQAGLEERQDKLWTQMSAWADDGVGSFYCADNHPSGFHEAVHSGSIEAIRLAARAAGDEQTRERIDETGQQGEDPSEVGDHWTVLCSAWAGGLASQGGCSHIVRELLSLGAHPDGCSKSPGLPLHVMVQMGDAKAVAALIEAGADPHRCAPKLGGGWETLMHCAIMGFEGGRQNRLDVWEVLAASGVDPFGLDDTGKSPFDRVRSERWGEVEAKMEASAMGKIIPSAPGLRGRGRM